MDRRIWLLLAAVSAVTALVTGPLAAQGVSIAVMGGTAYNFPTPLTVSQAGYPDYRITANYDTEPLGPYAPYYAWRISLWEGKEAWEIGQVHHRLFLINTDNVIQVFTIHFGYNYFLVGRAWKNNDFTLHLSIGPIITDPNNTIRGKILHTGGTGLFDAGYELSGVGAQVAVSRNLYFVDKAFVVLDLGLMGGLANVAVSGGSADVPNLSLHGHLGFGIDL